MRLALALLLLASGALAGCDGFGPRDALPFIESPNTNPERLLRSQGWRVVAIVSRGRAYRFPDEGYTVIFRDDGRVEGRAAANRYEGTYSARLDGFFEARGVTRTQSDDSPRASRRADLYLDVLRAATRFETDGATLQLRAPDGDGVQFRRIQFVTE